MALPWIKWSPRAALDGTAMLKPLEELAYRRILDLIFDSGDRLEDDDRIARATKTGARWPAVRDSLVALGKIRLEDGFIRNPRAERTLTEAARYFEQKKAASSKMNAARKALNNKNTGGTARNAGDDRPVSATKRRAPRLAIEDYAFFGEHLRLTHTDFASWQKAFSYLDLAAECSTRDLFLRGLPAGDERLKRVFMSTSNYFRARNHDAKEARLASQKPAQGLGGQAAPSPPQTPEQRLAEVLRLIERQIDSRHVTTTDVRRLLRAGKITPEQARMYGVTPEPSLPGI